MRKTRRVLFLDFDGVLNAGRDGYGTLKRRHGRLVQAVHLMTGCEVVVSSAWRVGSTLERLRKTLRGIGYPGPVVGVTPQLSAPLERGDEIHRYLREECAAGRPVSQFAVLDDESDMRGVHTHLVQTDTWDGLQRRDAMRAVRVLMGWP